MRLAVLRFEGRENGTFRGLVLLVEGKVVVGVFVDLFTSPFC